MSKMKKEHDQHGQQILDVINAYIVPCKVMFTYHRKKVEGTIINAQYGNQLTFSVAFEDPLCNVKTVLRYTTVAPDKPIKGCTAEIIKDPAKRPLSIMSLGSFTSTAYYFLDDDGRLKATTLYKRNAFAPRCGNVLVQTRPNDEKSWVLLGVLIPDHIRVAKLFDADKFAKWLAIIKKACIRNQMPANLKDAIVVNVGRTQLLGRGERSKVVKDVVVMDHREYDENGTKILTKRKRTTKNVKKTLEELDDTKTFFTSKLSKLPKLTTTTTIGAVNAIVAVNVNQATTKVDQTKAIIQEEEDDDDRTISDC